MTPPEDVVIDDRTAKPKENEPDQEDPADLQGQSGWKSFLGWTFILGTATLWNHYADAIGGNRHFVVVVLAALLWLFLLLGAALRGSTISSDISSDKASKWNEKLCSAVRDFRDDAKKEELGSLPWLLHRLQSTVALTLVFLILLSGSFAGEHIAHAGQDLLWDHLFAQRVPDPPVVIVDISSIPYIYKRDSAATGLPDKYTSRHELLRVLESMTAAANRPLCVGVDVNFHNPAGGFMSDDDDSFLEYCLAQRTSTAMQRMPIYVAVAGCPGDKPETWLSKPEYATLAADTDMPSDDASIMLTGYRWKDNGVPITLPTLAMALSGEYWRSSGQQVPSVPWLTQMVGPFVTDEPLFRQQPVINGEVALVDYRYLDYLKSTAVTAESLLDDPGSARKLAGKIVILGDIQDASIDDSFVIPQYSRPQAGVLLQGCLVSTLTTAPLLMLSPIVTGFADMALAIFVLVVVWALAKRKRPAGRHLKPWFLVTFSCVTAVTVVFLSLFLADRHIFWPDMLVVSTALLLHRPAEIAIRAISGQIGTVITDLYTPG